MRDVFAEYYWPDELREKEYVEGAIIALDTNVLLSFYGLSADARSHVFEVLERLKQRLWIPWHVGREFQAGRLANIQTREGVWQKAKNVHRAIHDLDRLEREFDALEGLPDDVKQDLRNQLQPLSRNLQKAVAPFEKRVSDLMTEHAVTLEVAVGDDPVRERLDQILVGRVGHAPTVQETTKRIEEFEERAANEIPPGYKDGGKESSERRAGDYLIWCDLLEHSKANPDNLILFVTNDAKDDWYVRRAGEPRGPRPELCIEMRDPSIGDAKGYHQMQSEKFLALAAQIYQIPIDQETLHRVSESNEIYQRAAADRQRRAAERRAKPGRRHKGITHPASLKTSSAGGQIAPDDHITGDAGRLMEAWVREREQLRLLHQERDAIIERGFTSPKNERALLVINRDIREIHKAWSSKWSKQVDDMADAMGIARWQLFRTMPALEVIEHLDGGSH